MLTRLMMLTGLVAMMLANASAAQADHRVALVVGNSAYASTASLAALPPPMMMGPYGGGYGGGGMMFFGMGRRH
jgi:hypothetical protein